MRSSQSDPTWLWLLVPPQYHLECVDSPCLYSGRKFFPLPSRVGGRCFSTSTYILDLPSRLTNARGDPHH